MKNKPAILYYSLASLFWLLLWQVAAKQIGKELFLPAPIQVFTVLVTELLPSKSCALFLSPHWRRFSVRLSCRGIFGCGLPLLRACKNTSLASHQGNQSCPCGFLCYIDTALDGLFHVGCFYSLFDGASYFVPAHSDSTLTDRSKTA